MMRGFILLAALLLPITASAVQTGDEIRIDMPTTGKIKVRNDFGDVSIEVWQNSYVTVSATIEGAVKFTRSPVVIDNRGSLLTISVVRRPIDPVAAINLKLKVPMQADTSDVTARGMVLRQTARIDYKVAHTEAEPSQTPQRPS